jgi:Divergent InlB B-repeat domain
MRKTGYDLLSCWLRQRSFVAGAFAAAAILIGTERAPAQTSLLGFDPHGNLQAQTAETLAPPQILGQPGNLAVGPGQAGSFLVVAADTRNLSYQWSFNGTNLSGANGDALLLPDVSAANEGQYQVVLSNPSGSVTSAPAMLWLDANGNGLPDSWELTYFGNLNQTATGDFDHDGVSNFQEFLDGTNPANATSVLYHLTVLSDGGSVAVVPNQPGYTNGQTVTLTAIGNATAPFRAWTGDIVSSSNTISLVMTTNKTLYAHFTPLTFLWSSAASGDWNVASNWTPSLVPGDHDSAIIQSSVTVTLTSDLQLTDLTLGGSGISPTLSGTGTVTAPGANLAITFLNAMALNSRTLENGGTALWTGSGTIPLTAAVITNRPGAVFEVQNAGSFLAGGAPYRVDNAGIFRKTGSTGQFTVGQYIPFTNYGSVEIQAGTLSLAGGGLNQATMSVAAGSVLDLALGTFTASAASSITGAGDFSVSGATANLDGLVNPAGTHTFSFGTVNLTGTYFCTNNTLNIYGADANFNGNSVVSPLTLNLTGGPRGGSLGGTNEVTVLGQMNWTGGNMWGGGRTLIAPGATLTLHAASQDLGPRTLENAGTTVVVGTGLGVAQAVITNRPGAVFEVQNAGGFTSSGTPDRFDNAGTFRKTVSTGQFTVGQYIPFTNYGMVDIEAGTLAASGGYSCTSDSLLQCALGGTTPGTGYGQLQVAGTVALQGNLGVTLTSGFAPALGDTFTVLTAGTRTGSFAGFFYPSNAVTMDLSNTPNSVLVRVLAAAPPQPVLLSPQLSGSNFVLTWTAISNDTYRLEFSPDLSPTGWTALPGDVTSLSNFASKADPLTPSNRFYRVQLVP